MEEMERRFESWRAALTDRNKERPQSDIGLRVCFGGREQSASHRLAANQFARTRNQCTLLLLSRTRTFGSLEGARRTQ